MEGEGRLKAGILLPSHGMPLLISLIFVAVLGLGWVILSALKPPRTAEEKERAVVDQALSRIKRGQFREAKGLLEERHPGGPRMGAIVYETMLHERDPDRLAQAKRARDELAREMEAEARKRVQIEG